MSPAAWMAVLLVGTVVLGWWCTRDVFCGDDEAAVMSADEPGIESARGAFRGGAPSSSPTAVCNERRP